MSKVCDKCGRGPQTSISRSHANNLTKRTLHINLQTKRVDGVKHKMCTKCIKALAKV